MGKKAELPQELREAMELDNDQFEELEIDTLELVIMVCDVNSDILSKGVVFETESAWRPSDNPRRQYYAIRHRIAVDRNTGEVRHEVDGFKPMPEAEYVAYCISEFGEAPVGLGRDPSEN